MEKQRSACQQTDLHDNKRKKNTLAYTLCEVETEVWVVTQVAMLEKVKFQTL